jgi:hypothetical protein
MNMNNRWIMIASRVTLMRDTSDNILGAGTESECKDRW